MTRVLFRLLLLYRVVVLTLLLWCRSLSVRRKMTCVFDTLIGRFRVTVLLPMPMTLLLILSVCAEVSLIVVKVLPTLIRLRLSIVTFLPL